MSFQNPTDERIVEILTRSKNIAIIGLSPKAHRDSYRVAERLQNAGFKIFPVNPAHAGKEILGEKVYATVAEIPEKIDIVDVFRRSEELPNVANELKTLDFGYFWAQLGLEHEEVPKILGDRFKGRIIMNRCTKKDWDELVLPSGYSLENPA